MSRIGTMASTMEGAVMSPKPQGSQGSGMGAAAGLGAALAITQGITSFVQARRRASAIDDAMDSQRRAARVRFGQINRAAGLSREQRLREAHRIRGSIRVAAAEAGTTTGAFADQLRQADFDVALNTNVIEANRRAQLERIRTGTQANLQRLAAGQPIPGAAGASGALRGLGTGLQLGTTFGRLGQQSPQEPTRPTNPNR